MDEFKAVSENARRENRRRNIIAVVVVILILSPLAMMAYRPAWVLGIEPGTLAHSVGGSAPHAPTCTQHEDGIWRCTRWDSRSSSPVPYRVRTHGDFGCWSAWRDDHGSPTAPHMISGCITFLDALSPL